MAFVSGLDVFCVPVLPSKGAAPEKSTFVFAVSVGLVGLGGLMRLVNQLTVWSTIEPPLLPPLLVVTVGFGDGDGDGVGEGDGDGDGTGAGDVEGLLTGGAVYVIAGFGAGAGAGGGLKILTTVLTTAETKLFAALTNELKRPCCAAELSP